MKYPQHDVYFRKQKQRLEIVRALYNIATSKLAGLEMRDSFHSMMRQIYDEMRKLSNTLDEDILKPLLSVIHNDNRKTPEYYIKIKAILSVSKEFESKLVQLRGNINKANDGVSQVEDRLDEEMPDVNDLEQLDVEDRVNLTQLWKEIEMFLRGLQLQYKAIKTVWDVMMATFVDGIQNPIGEVVKMLGNDAAN